MSNGDKDGNEIKFDKDGKPIIQIDKPIPKWLQQLLRDVRENKNPHRKKGGMIRLRYGGPVSFKGTY